MKKLTEEQTREFLKKITRSEEEYYEMIARLALTFQLRFSQIGNLLRINPEEVGPVLRKALFAKDSNQSSYLVNALDNLNAYAFKDYNRTMDEFNTFMMDLYMAYVGMQKGEEKDQAKAKAITLRSFIYDIPVARFRQNHEVGTPISPDDALALIHYQIKFFLSPVTLCKFCKITNEEYQSCLKLAQELDPNITKDYAEILKIYQVAENNKSNDIKNNDTVKKIYININPQENKEKSVQRG